MAIVIKKASRSRVFLKLAFQGPSGSGKSYSALKIARGLVGPEGKIGAIDTENGSLSLYSHVTDFDVADLADFSPETYVEAIKAFEAAGYDCLIIDSITHAWKYILEQKAALDARGGNQYANWKGPKERYAKLTAAVLQSKMHIVCNMRAKTEYVQNEGSKGYTKAGMAAVAEPDSEFEYTVVFSMGMDHRALCGVEGQGKDRTGLFARMGSFTPDESTGVMLADWLGDAPDQTIATPTAATVAPIDTESKKPVPATGAYLKDVMKFTAETLAEYKTLCANNGLESAKVTPILMAINAKSFDQAREVIAFASALSGCGIECTGERFVEMLAIEPDTEKLAVIIDAAVKSGIPDYESFMAFLKDSKAEDKEPKPEGEKPKTGAKAKAAA